MPFLSPACLPSTLFARISGMVECELKPKQEDRGVSILIADDDDALRESLCLALRPMGFTVYLASGGAAAVSLVKHTVIDIAILDVNMPDLNGIEAMRLIRKVRRTVDGIFITSEVSSTVRRRAVSAGARTIVRKPIRIEKLRVAVKNILARRGTREGVV